MPRSRSPSLPVICFAAVLVAAVFLPHYNRLLISDADTFMHARIGQDILSAAAPPRFDVYSWTREGAPYVGHEWLFQAISGAFFRLRETDGLILFGGLLWASIVALLVAHALRRGASALGCVLALIPTCLLEQYSLQTRPHLVTWLGFAGGLLALDHGWWQRPGLRPWLATLAAASLWANMHLGFFLFLGMLALECAAGVIEVARGRAGWRVPAWTAALFAAFASGTLLNPYGTGVHGVALHFAAQPVFRQLLHEHVPVSEAGPMLSAYLAFMGLLVIAAAIAGRRFRVAQWLQLGALATLSWFSARTTALLAVAAFPWLAEALSLMLKRLWPGQANERHAWPWQKVWLTLSVSIVAARVALFGAPVPRSALEAFWGFPAGAVAYAREHLSELGPRLFNELGLGGYLICSLKERKVSIDGRAEFYGASALEDHARILADRDGQALRTLGERAIDWVMVRKRWPLAASLGRAPGRWMRLFDQGQVVIFVARPKQ